MRSQRTLTAMLPAILIAFAGCSAEPLEPSLDERSSTQEDELWFLTNYVTENPLLASPDWPSAGHDWAHTGHNPAETELSPSTVSTMVEVWRHEFSPAPDVQIPVMAAVVAAGDVAYIADFAGFVHARKASDGSLLWTQPVSTASPDPFFGAVLQGAPVVTNDALYVGDADSIIFKLDRATGTTLWSTQVETHPDALIQGDLATVGPYVIYGVSSYENTYTNDLTMRGSVGALLQWNGSRAWTAYTTSDQSLPNPKWGAGVAVWSSPAIDALRGHVYIGTGQYYEPGSPNPHPFTRKDKDYSDSLLQISLITGKITRSRQFTEGDIFGLQYPLGPDADLGTPPNLFTARTASGVWVPAVGVGDKTGNYYVMDRRNLKVLWTRQISQGSVLGGFQATAAYADGVIYVASHERIDGSSLNTGIPPDLDAAFLQTPEGTMLIQQGSRTHIMALDAGTGDIIWDTYANGAITFAPLIIANGVLYHGNANGKLCALDAANGSTLHCEQIGGMPDGAGGALFGNIITALSLSRGRLYVSYVPALPGAPNGVSAYGLP